MNSVRIIMLVLLINILSGIAIDTYTNQRDTQKIINQNTYLQEQEALLTSDSALNPPVSTNEQSPNTYVNERTTFGLIVDIVAKGFNPFSIPVKGDETQLELAFINLIKILRSLLGVIMVVQIIIILIRNKGQT